MLCIEGFNGKLRDELVDRELFDTLLDSMVLIDNFTWEGQPVQAGTGAASHN